MAANSVSSPISARAALVKTEGLAQRTRPARTSAIVTRIMKGTTAKQKVWIVFFFFAKLVSLYDDNNCETEGIDCSSLSLLNWFHYIIKELKIIAKQKG